MKDYAGFSHIVLYIWLVLDNSILGVQSLRNMSITVPEAVRYGDTITLSCDYDLESVALYTIKWYRNEEEFYRFVPKESPPSKVFIMPHLNVDLSESNATKVTLKDVERETAGTFKCEVSADAPLFHTDVKEAKLLVADIPDEEPVLRTDIHKLTPGAILTSNCTTPGSFPSMNVTWYINGEKIESSPGTRVQNSIVFYDALPGLETVRSSLVVNTTQEHFKYGRMKLACRATIFSLYNETKEVEILEDAPQIAPIREPNTHSDGFTNGDNPVRTKSMTLCLLSILLYQLWIRRWNHI